MEKKNFGLSDFPQHRANLEEQAANLGLEGARSQTEREAYARRLIRGILTSDLLDNVRVIGETRLVHGQGGGHTIPEFERMVDTWLNFPRETLASIIEEEQRAIRMEEARKGEDDEEEEEAKVA